MDVCIFVKSDDPKYYQKKYFKDKRSKTTSEFPKKFHKNFIILQPQ